MNSDNLIGNRHVNTFILLVLAGSMILINAGFSFAAIEDWRGNGPFGGAVYSLAVDPGNQDVVYAGTSMGVYKTIDGGLNWNGANIDYYTGVHRVIRALAIDPGGNQIVYAGSNNNGVLFCFS